MNKNIPVLSTGSLAAIPSIYNFIEAFFIFPITPSTAVSFGIKDKALAGHKNMFGFVPTVHQYQAESGVAAGIHGALQNGIIASTCTGSQGLLLMIPNLYKIVGELLPAVFHVAARSIATRSLSISGDHSDIYACRQTGIIMISSSSPQEVHDLAAIVYPITLEASYPILHFYEANVVSNVVCKIYQLSENQYQQIHNHDDVLKFRKHSLTPFKPVTRGGHENADTLFQGREAANQYVLNAAKVIKKHFEKWSKITGREYKIYSYYGCKNPKNVMIAMGSICENAKNVVDNLNTKGYECGILKITLYRPFLVEDFIATIPKSARNFAILSRTKENGSPAEPLFVDVATAFVKTNTLYDKMANGRYGLSSKNISDGHIKSIFDDLRKSNYKKDFTIGIIDDVTNLSLPLNNDYDAISKSFSQRILLYGTGGDGTVSLANSVVQIIGNYYQEKDIRLNSVYNSLKQNNITQSMIEISDKKMIGFRLPQEFNYIMCNLDSLLLRINAVKNISDNGIFILNTTFNKDDIELFLPNSFKKAMAEKKCRLFIVNANKIAKENNLDDKISMILSATLLEIFSPNKVVFNDFKNILESEIRRRFTEKGKKVVENNISAINKINSESIYEIPIKAEWKNVRIFKKPKTDNAFTNYIDILEELEGESVTVAETSSCGSNNIADGTLVNQNNTFNAKKKLNILTPRWIPENCIQCNKCALVCPHATIRAFLLSPKDIENAPQEMETLYAVGSEGHRFRIQVDTENCVGCSLCAEVCPVDALEMVPAKEEHDKYTDLTNYLYKEITYKHGDFSTDMYKGVSFLYPYFEASGACKGCGETPYYRLLTQLFGKFMVIANATGCTSIYGGHQTTPFAIDKDGCGPAWANSLFEDNAEFGLGMRMAEDYKIRRMFDGIEKYYSKVEKPLQKKFDVLLKEYHNADRMDQFENRKDLIKEIESSKYNAVKDLLQYKDSFVRKSMWMIGGDGWAYDIGFGGIRHVVDSGKNINILILNTETYSNTGGQISAASASPAGGKPIYNSALRTELGQILLTHKNVYVAQVSLGMNPNQVVKAFKEAEAYDGPSVIIAYCPCISHGFDLKYHALNEREAVLSGYWTIFRYDPRLIKEQKNPLQIDFKAPKFETIPRFLFPQTRFKNQYNLLKKAELAKMNGFINYLKRNFETLQILSQQQFSDDVNYFESINKALEENKSNL